METFTHNGQQCISINGKDYFLVRGYKKSYHSFVFVQVSGRTPLRKEDLPSKGWEVMRTKAADGSVWTAWQKSCFRYDTGQADATLVFVGASTEGSYYLALRHLAGRFSLDISEEGICEAAGRYAGSRAFNPDLERLHDEGNSGSDAVLLRLSEYFDEKRARSILKGGEDRNEH